jgi:RNA 2',3'-cyclic 3'-phosphodiesterase
MNRLFVAIAMPEQIRPQLAALSGGLPGARWVSEDNLHLTLRFIGEVHRGVMDDVADALDRVRLPPFQLVLEGLGHWEAKGKARVVWIGVRPEPALNALQKRIEQVLIAAGLEPERRRFRPHITLARLRDAPDEWVVRYIQQHSPFSLPAFEVDSFTLFRSYLKREGSVYQAEAEYPLGSGRPGGGFDDIEAPDDPADDIAAAFLGAARA